MTTFALMIAACSVFTFAEFALYTLLLNSAFESDYKILNVVIFVCAFEQEAGK